ncbi:MMPL family transporter [Hymenobacter busanensis]|uniref:MMPL family transporter n=1 Tax=Hymenobacter busanensis TaxID=2607656 RepID=A0A7L4ZXZ6_9BACT|nr:efflux RND transporter permease subunit [Hymenobacter busanensis]KAA9332952.1 MMPL family transporter [Hymenobacter busanensis]QHJ08374.1 MMPL family transporter [Hymenobacter busanensis]
MWSKLALLIIKNRRLLVGLLAIITAFMAWKAKDVEMTYDFAQVVSPDDPDMVYFQQFKKTFGEDGNVLVLGLQDSSVYKLGNFNELRLLTDTLSKVEGVSGVLSVTKLIQLTKDTANQRFATAPIFHTFPQTQQELDSLMRIVNRQEFYKGQLISPTTGATLLALTMDPKYLNSSKRQAVMKEVLGHAERFTKKTNIRLHYAGLPYVRSTMTTKVAGEMKFFLMLAALVTSVTLLVFFRTWSAVVFPLLIVGVAVIWCVGTIVLLGYKITLLTGLIPSILIVIGIPNCTYLLSRYHYDYRISGNQVLAMVRVVRKIGLVTLMNNTSTAIGFFVFCFTNIAILYQFGWVATISIFAAFFISIILVPIVFTYLPPPTPKQLEHLDAKPLTKLLEFFDYLVLERRGTVYGIALVLCALGALGASKLQSVSYMVDDLPKNSSVNSDLKFFEEHFNGVMPLEIVVDTGKKRGILKLKNLERIDRLENYLRTQPVLTSPISIVTFLKAATQTFYNGDPSYYRLPDNSERNFILSYLARSQSAQGKSASMDSKLLRSFTDSTGQKARISLKIADIGSRNLDTLLITKIQPQINEIFTGTGMEVKMTGTTILFTKGNEYVIGTLKESLVLAFALVGLIVLILFRSIRSVFFTLLPNFVTLLLTAGIMGFFGIALKPATALIFCIALGIDGDNSIHLLAKFRQEMAANGRRVKAAISTTLSEAGTSMIYTSIVLFVGFSIFAFSEFGGTKALGLLMSASLLITNFSNLILLPALLVTFEHGKDETIDSALIQHYDEQYHEEDDDLELNLNRIQVKPGASLPAAQLPPTNELS